MRRTAPLPLLRPLVAALTLLGAAAGGVLAAGPAAAADDVTWGVATADGDYGSARTSYHYALDPGSSANDAMLVTNHGETALTLAVYAADGYTTDAGQLDVLAADATSTGVGAWVHTAVDEVTVEPGQTLEVPFTVTLPDDATPGDHRGGIVTSLRSDDAVQGVTVDRRIGIAIDLRIGGELSPTMAVTDVHVSYAGGLDPTGGEATVTWTVSNTGNAVLVGRSSVQVTGPFGLLPRDADAVPDTPALLPGESRTLSATVPGIPATGVLAATVTLTPVLTDASGSTSTLDPLTASGRTAAMPWAVLALVVVLVGLAVWWPRRRRRIAAARKAREDERVQAAVEAALNERAEVGSTPRA
jgi:hypothetical protein